MLGWSNADKLRALIARRERLEAQIGESGVHLAETQAARAELDTKRDALARLEEFTRFVELDWRTPARDIQQLEDERARLESTSDVLQELNQQLKSAKHVQDQIKQKIGAMQEQRGEIKGERRALQSRRVQCLETWRAAPPDTERAAQLEQLRAESQGKRQLKVEDADQLEDTMQHQLNKHIGDADRQLNSLGTRIIKQMMTYRNTFQAESTEMDANLEAAHEYENQLDQLRRDDLPRFESRFKELLNVNTINEIANFNAQLMRERETIHERIMRINHSLQVIDYTPGRYITLLAQPSPDAEIRDFQRDLRLCIEGALSGSGDEQYSETKFLQVKAIIDRFRGREGLKDQDKRWRAKVTDVRNWFLFSASERWREDETEYEHYSDSGGKSGGQKEKLAYTVLAASLAYQFGLEGSAQRSRTFRFVVIDEAFGRGSDESARYGLRLFEQLDLQLLIVTPLQKIHIIEPFVSSLGFVHSPDGRESRLRTLSIEDYQAEKARAEAESAA